MRAALIGLALAVTTTAAVDRRRGVGARTQFPGGGGRRRSSRGRRSSVQGNTPYDGRFVFIRLRCNSGFGDGRARRPAVAARLSARRSPLHEDPEGDHRT